MTNMTATISLLADMVATPSVSCGLDGQPDDIHGESRMVELVADYWRRHAIDYEIQPAHPGRDNIIARIEGRPGPSLLLEAHTDTVEIENMQIDPFDPVIRDGKLYGRGSCDCKASLAAMMVGMTRAAESGIFGTITLAATANEECGYGGALAMVAAGFTADGAVIGEPTGLRLATAHKGTCRISIVTHGVAAHSSEPDKGLNAIYTMSEVLQALRKHATELSERQPHPLVGPPACSVTTITGGQAPNIVPDRCEIVVDRRTTPGETANDALEQVREAVEYFAGESEDRTCEQIFSGEPMESDPDSEVVVRVRRALEEVTGDSTIIGVQYGTDAGVFAKAGIPSVVVGPGNIEQAHTACEYVDIAQVDQATAFFQQLCSG
jgi:succinyl-diaminopimelate desuccinylase